MKPLRVIGLLILSASALCCLAPHSLRGQTAESPALDLQSSILLPDSIDQWTADSIAQARRDSVFNLTTGAFKRLLDMKLSSAGPDSVFTQALTTYRLSLSAIDEFERYSEPWYKIKSTLRELDTDMEDGAYHYSAVKNDSLKGVFAQNYLDIQAMDIFAGEVWPRDNSYPLMAYIAASKAYNDAQYDRAIRYFNTYLSTGEQQLREQIYIFLGQACLNSGNNDLAVTAMTEGVKLYPHNPQLQLIAIKACINGGHAELIQPFLTKALELNPDDETLLRIQGNVYEDQNKYQRALDTFLRLDRLKPQSLDIAKHIALCYYNMGVANFNEAVNEPDEKLANKKRRQSYNYFSSATQKLEEVLASDPMSVKYLKALGVSYLAINSKTQFDDINRRLISLGQEPLGAVFMPPVVSTNEGNRKHFDWGIGEGAVFTDEIPLYSDFGRDYITNGLVAWAKKGEFEKMDDYRARVNDTSIRNEYEKLNRQAQEEFLKTYSNKLRINDLKLMPYDATNETFKIESPYGDIFFSVPLKNKEAELFKSNWEALSFRQPVFYIDNDKVKLASISVNTPNGKSYTFDNSQAVRYANTEVSIDFTAILDGINSRPDDMAHTSTRPTPGGAPQSTITLESDVDKNIPRTNKQQPGTLALIIANENYGKVSKVKSALHDGMRFAQYCQETLGIPANNITLLKDATYGDMTVSMDQLKNTAKSFGGNVDIIVYYAGHGIPDEKSSDAYLMPVDATPTSLAANYQLEKFYADLGQTGANNIMVFLDACFSGSNRDGAALVNGRAVGYKPRQASPRGNMFVLTAASGHEIAFPYAQKNHGLFTYYLLRKIQETKGDVTLKQLADYVTKSVSQQSNLINKKPQNPTVSTSGTMANNWKSKKLRP